MPRPNDAAPDIGPTPPVSFPEPNVSLADAVALPAKLRWRLTAWLRVTGRFDNAAGLLDAIERETGASGTLLDERMALALARGDASEVQAFWQDRLAGDPAPSARASHGRALLELGQIDAAASIAESLLAAHGDLVTVRNLEAEIALLQGDLATAHDLWSSQLADNDARIAPQLALARIALLGGDVEEARTLLDRLLVDPSILTAAQVASAAGLAELLGQPARAQMLRLRYVRLETARAAALAAEIDAALGRAPSAGANGQVPGIPTLPSPSLRHLRELKAMKSLHHQRPRGTSNPLTWPR